MTDNREDGSEWKVLDKAGGAHEPMMINLEGTRVLKQLEADRPGKRELEGIHCAERIASFVVLGSSGVCGLEWSGVERSGVELEW